MHILAVVASAALFKVTIYTYLQLVYKVYVCTRRYVGTSVRRYIGGSGMNEISLGNEFHEISRNFNPPSTNFMKS